MGNRIIESQRVAAQDEDEYWDSELQIEMTTQRIMASRDQVIKIKISKKQLHQFLQKGMSIEQLLAEILNNGCVVMPSEGGQLLQQHWRPALNSIAE